MNQILDTTEKKSMYAQINDLSEEKIYLLAENDPIINKKEVEDQISNVLGLNSDMQNYTNSLEAQPLIRLEGYGLPDIIPVQTQAKKMLNIGEIKLIRKFLINIRFHYRWQI